MPIPEYFELDGGDRMPRIGFGTWQDVTNVCTVHVQKATLEGIALERVVGLKYLGHIVTEDMKDYINMDRERRAPLFDAMCWLTGLLAWCAPEASDEVLEKAVESALEAGYRHFDTARAYENEAALGRALNRWISGDPAKRKQLFVVTKLPPGGNRPELVQEYFDASLRDLNLDYVDMYLLHVPFAFENIPGDLHPKNPDGSMKVDLSTDLIELWKTISKLKESGRVRHVGVSNLNESQLSRVCAVNKPACLQVEVHALCQQPALIAAANRLGVPIVAYSPLGSKGLADALAAKTGREYPDLLTLPVVQRIAQAHERTPAQVLLRYTLQRGLAAIPKSTNPDRIKQNISLWDFELSATEMSELAALDRGENGRICDFSFFIGIDKHPEFPFKK